MSNGWITLLRPLGTILPCAVAMMSIVPQIAQAIARQKTLMMTTAIARPTGEGGVSTISKAAGRKAISRSRRRATGRGNTTTELVDFIA